MSKNLFKKTKIISTSSIDIVMRLIPCFDIFTIIELPVNRILCNFQFKSPIIYIILHWKYQ